MFFTFIQRIDLLLFYIFVEQAQREQVHFSKSVKHLIANRSD